MKIKLARTSGFCMGVKKAMDIALDTAHRKGRPIYTHGPLIHNPQTIELLDTKGIRILQKEDGPSPDGTIIIRAHGISPKKSEEIKDNFGELIDATCPRVKKVQNFIRLHAEKGHTIVIVGDREHPEVEGLMGFSCGRGIAITTPEEVDLIPTERPICVVAQTTQDWSLFDRIAQKIKERFTECKVYNTICQSTHRRQADVLMLSKGVDAMIIVGGKNSANTGRLAQLSASTGTPTFHIETEEELNPEVLSSFRTIGITAGASTPNWMIKKVIGELRKIRPAIRRRGLDHLLHFWEFLIKTNLYVALGAAGLSLTNCLIQGIEPDPKFLLIASLYIFSMHLLNRYTDKAAGKFNDPPRAEFYEENEKIFLPLSILGLILSVVIASWIGSVPFAILLTLTLLGTLYNVRIVPSGWLRSFPYRRLKDIPFSKTLSVAFGWGVVTALIPFLQNPAEISSVTVFAFFLTVALVFVRSAQFDILDIQGDRIVGKETLPIMIGEKKTVRLALVLMVLCALLLFFFAFVGLLPDLGYWLIFGVLYCLFYLFLLWKQPPMETLFFEGLVDGNFIFIGIIALVWKLWQP